MLPAPAIPTIVPVSSTFVPERDFPPATGKVSGIQVYNSDPIIRILNDV